MAETDNLSWNLVTCAGEQPAWVARLAEVLGAHWGAHGAVAGVAAPADARASLCPAAWAYDAMRKRVSRALQPEGTVPSRALDAGLEGLVSLLAPEPDDSAQRVIVLSANGQPAVDLRRTLERAMIAGAGELELAAAWRDGEAHGVIIWRCALVEWSIALSMDRAAAKLQGLLRACLAPRAALAESPPPRLVPALSSLSSALARPGPLTVALKQATRRLSQKDQWAITVYRDLDDDALWPSAPGINLVPPVDRFWADPFLAREGDRLWVFFEELKYAAPKGTLRCLAIDRDGHVGAPIDVLEEPCHLSYPNVFQHDGEWYMLPESSARRNLVLYRARRFPAEWVPVAELLSDVCVVDATLHRDDRGWWLLAASADSPGGSFDDSLHVYRAQDLLGPWVASPRNAVRSDPASARPAGPMFQWRGKWLRPVQDCRGRYGRAMHLMEVETIDEHGPVERLVATIRGDERAGVQCTHTYARLGRDLAVDWQRWRPRWRGADGLAPPALSLELADC